MGAVTAGFKVRQIDFLPLQTSLTVRQESIENVIDFPEDHPAVLELMIMMLYDYTFEEAFKELVGTQEYHIQEFHINLLPQLYELAKKYQLPHLLSTVLETLKRILEKHAAIGLKGFYWQLATYLDEDEDRAAEMRRILLDAFRKHAKSLSGEANWVKANLLNCPKLAIELAMSGGLDGKGMNIV